MNLYNKIDHFLEDQYHRLPLWYLIAFLVGILACFTFEVDVHWFLPPSLTLLALFMAKRNVVHIFLLLIALSFFFGYLRGYIRINWHDNVTMQEPIITALRGEVYSIKYNEKGAWIYLNNLIFQEFPLEDDWPRRVRVKIRDMDARNLNIGDYIESSVYLAPPIGPILPGAYDFGMDAYFSNIGAYGYSMGKVRIIDSNHGGSFLTNLVNLIRKKLYYIFLENMGSRGGNFAAALFLGEQRGIDKRILQDMRLAGISHILCVSGMHLSLVAGIFYFLPRIIFNFSDNIAFNFNIRKLSAIISIIASFAYLMISSAGIASVRAFIMTFLVMCAIIINRKVLSLRSIAIAAFVIIMMNPEYILYPSFQLSFMAACSLMAGYEIYSSHRSYLHVNSKHILAKILNNIILNIYSSIVITIGTGGLIIYHFYIISNYVILGNLLTLPIVAFVVMPIGILSIILAPFGLEHASLKVMEYSINLIITIANYITNMKNSVYYFGHIDHKYLLFLLFGLFWIIICQGRCRFLGIIPFILSIILMIMAPKPSLLVNLDIGFIAFQNQKGQLEIMGRNISEFHMDYINNYYGQRVGPYHNFDIRLHNYLIKTGSGKGVFIRFTDSEAEEEYDKILDFTNDKKSSLVLYDQDI